MELKHRGAAADGNCLSFSISSYFLRMFLCGLSIRTILASAKKCESCWTTNMASGFPRAQVLRARQKNMMALLRPYLETYITSDILYLLKQKLTQVQGKETQTLPPNGRNIKITVKRE